MDFFDMPTAAQVVLLIGGVLGWLVLGVLFMEGDDG